MSPTDAAVLRQFSDRIRQQASRPMHPLMYDIANQLSKIADELDAAIADRPQPTPPQYPHWRCRTHGAFDAYWEVGCPTCVREMRAALAAMPRQRSSWEHELCRVCEGNGVFKIPGGISMCPRCRGTCYEPPDAGVPAAGSHHSGPRAPQEMVVPEATVEVCGLADERPER